MCVVVGVFVTVFVWFLVWFCLGFCCFGLVWGVCVVCLGFFFIEFVGFFAFGFILFGFLRWVSFLMYQLKESTVSTFSQLLDQLQSWQKRTNFLDDSLLVGTKLTWNYTISRRKSMAAASHIQRCQQWVSFSGHLCNSSRLSFITSIAPYSSCKWEYTQLKRKKKHEYS